MSTSFDRVLLIRHLAICAAAALAYVLREELRTSSAILWIIGASALLNGLALVVRTHPQVSRLCLLGSPVIGVASWAALASLTGGISSPFIAGLWLEAVLSAMALARAGIVLVTGAALVALWGQQLWLGLDDRLTELALQTAFLAGTGAVLFQVTRRWVGVRQGLESELEEERELGELGANTARIAHSLKSAVHGLRGFVSLIEPKLGDRDRALPALDGLRDAIRDLEVLARSTLDGGSPDRGEAGPARPCALLPVIDAAVKEVSISHPGIDWVRISRIPDGAAPTLDIPAALVQDVLVVLLQNAAQAMEGRGKVTLETRSVDDELEILVRDRGVGLSAEEIEKIFEPHYTTKAEGSGYGLYLARRLLKRHGGRLTATAAAGGGALFQLTLPASGGSERLGSALP